VKGIWSIAHFFRCQRTQDDGSHVLRGAETSSLEPQIDLSTEEAGDDDEDEEFVYPGVQADQAEGAPPPQTLHPSPAQLESLYAAASSGDLPLLQRLFKNAIETNGVQPFGLANDATSRTGFTVLHAAASRGYLEIVKWRESLSTLRSRVDNEHSSSVVDHCGAMPDVEDREGEVRSDQLGNSGLPTIPLDCVA
jgi:hypothetical protein